MLESFKTNPSFSLEVQSLEYLKFNLDYFFSFSSSYYYWIRKHPTLSMDKVLSLNSSRSLAGIIISHAFVHSVLFGSYESGKYIINTFISFSESLFQPSNNYKMNMLLLVHLSACMMHKLIFKQNNNINKRVK